MTGLTSLRTVGDLSHVRNMENLVTLIAMSCSDLAPLSVLRGRNLRSLVCSESNGLQSVPLLPGLTALRELDCSYGRLMNDFGGLASLPGLTRLDCSHGHDNIVDFSPLSVLVNLQFLNCCNQDHLADLRHLSHLKALRVLGFYTTAVSDLTPLAPLTLMREMRLQRTEVSDLTPLSGMLFLQRLDISCTKVSHLTPLSALTGLQELGLTGIPAVTHILLHPLVHLTGLRRLDLRGIGDSSGVGYRDEYYDEVAIDLSPLTELTGLQYVDARECWAEDLSPLAAMTWLGWGEGPAALDASDPAIGRGRDCYWFSNHYELYGW